MSSYYFIRNNPGFTADIAWLILYIGGVFLTNSLSLVSQGLLLVSEIGRCSLLQPLTHSSHEM